jgi:hypothetical protein
MPVDFHLTPAKFRGSQSGVVAVEFALMAIPLATMLLLMVDLLGNDSAFQSIDEAGLAAVRNFRDGSASPLSYTLESARDELICAGAPKLKCDAVVVSLSGLASPVRINARDVNGAQWCAGAGEDALVLQVAYPVPFLTRLWAGDLESRKPYFVTSFALRNPPGPAAGLC